MPGRPHIYSAAFTTDVPEGGANTETVALTLAGVTSEFTGQQIVAWGILTFTAPAAITSLTIRIRKETITGTVVGEATIDAADPVATKLGVFHAFGIDPSADVSGGNYVLTFQGAGEGGPGTANAGLLQVAIS